MGPLYYLCSGAYVDAPCLPNVPGVVGLWLFSLLFNKNNSYYSYQHVINTNR
jgi:hypothetical protein